MIALRHAVLAALLSFAPATLFAQPAAAPEAPAAQTAGKAKTVAVVALAGYDRLLEDIDFLGELGGRPASADWVEGMLAFVTGGRGLEGLDKDRPIGVVLRTDGVAFTPLVCLPIPDLDPFLELAENFGLEPIDAGNGVYEVETPEQETVYIKQQGEWTYAAQSAEALAQVPADPSGPLKAIVGSYDIGVMGLVQNVPEQYRELLLTSMAQGMEDGLRQTEDESDEDFAQRRSLAEAQVGQIRDLITGIDRITYGLNIDSEGRVIFLDAEVTGVPGSDIALGMSAYDNNTSGVAGFHRPQKAFSLHMTGRTPPELLEKQKAQAESAITMVRTQVAKAIEEGEGLPDDPAAKEAIESAMNDLIDVYADMVREGRIELGASLDIEGEGFDLIAGAYAPDPSKVESVFKKLAEAASKDQDFPGVEWGYASHAGVTMHRIDFPVPDSEEAEAARQMFGESLRLVVGVGESRVYLGAGPRCEDALKQAINDSASMENKQVRPIEMAISLGQVLAAAEPFADAQAKPILGLMLDALEKAPVGKDRLLMTLDPTDNGGRFRFLLEEGVLSAVGQSAAAAAAMQQGGF